MFIRLPYTHYEYSPAASALGAGGAISGAGVIAVIIAHAWSAVVPLAFVSIFFYVLASAYGPRWNEKGFIQTLKIDTKLCEKLVKKDPDYMPYCAKLNEKYRKLVLPQLSAMGITEEQLMKMEISNSEQKVEPEENEMPEPSQLPGESYEDMIARIDREYIATDNAKYDAPYKNENQQP